MIRQAHNYLVGALSGVTLIGIAIAVFVVLVSAQVFHDWPIAALSSHNDQSSVAPAKALPGADQTADTVPTGSTAAAAPTNAAKAVASTAAPTAKRAHRHHHGGLGLLHAAQYVADQRHADDAASARHRGRNLLLGDLFRTNHRRRWWIAAD